MPKLTFDNLPEEKRLRFVAAAVDEFSAHPYRQASITRLVARLGIAKGSVYQYFENKAALYGWLMTHEVERHRALHMRGATPESGDVFTALARYATANLAFHLAEPKLARLARFAFAPTRDPDLVELHAQIRRTRFVFFRSLVERGHAAGTVRTRREGGGGGPSERDNAFVTSMVAHAVGDGLIDTALAEIDCDLASYLDAPFGRADALTDSRIAALVDDAVAFVQGAVAASGTVVGALEGGSGLALGEPPAAPADAPLGVVFEDEDAVALADEWWGAES